MNHQELKDKINQAAYAVGKTWPLYSFVTGNPLAGYEDKPFFEALKQGEDLWKAQVFPKAQVFRKAWKDGKIDSTEIERLLLKAGKKESAEYYLTELEGLSTHEYVNENHELDRLTVKWLSLFLDEGMATWPMPFKEMGFYTAWRKLITYDEEIKEKITRSIPKTAEDALYQVLANFDEADYVKIFEEHLLALPGWTGFIKYRMENDSIWNKAYPISLLDFLAVRLWMARCLRIPIWTEQPKIKNRSLLELQYLWLEAWERTWQNGFLERIRKSECESKKIKASKPDAQLVFCLDTRSERLRRALEGCGNYETFGAAGAFGLAMNYLHPDSGLVNKSSPAMVPSQYIVHESAIHKHEKDVAKYKNEGQRISAYTYFLKRIKNILPSAFGYVEGASFYYAALLLLRLFRPRAVDGFMLKHNVKYERIYEPHICAIDKKGSSEEIPLSEKVILVKSFFDSCGWRTFAPLVVFVGHASHSANNPYASSLDCGACAGNAGKNNARTLARMANSKQVRKELFEQHGIDIPSDTLFIAAEHITSTDEVELFDSEVPDSHQQHILALQKDFVGVKLNLTKTRLNEPKSTSWSDSRPEWGLSGHAGYIIGPRTLTATEVFSDCFMSSYDWRIDHDGAILKGIMQGPLTVCQWINNHYYFSTVDNDKFGAGSKITHNITGKYGVVQGNGSDLKIGLPLQSLMKSDDEVYHNPLRLSTLIQAPARFIAQILECDEKLRNLVENEWFFILVMDPEKNNEVTRYTYRSVPVV